MIRNQTIGRARHLFDGESSGAHTLPQGLLDATAQLAVVTAQSAAVSSPEVTENAALVEAGRRVAAGGDLDLTAVRQAREARTDYELTAGAMSYARENAENTVAALILAGADEIMHDHLAPAQADVLADVARAHETYSKYGDGNAAMLAAPKAARDAWLSMDSLVHRFSQIRRSVGSLRLATESDAVYDREPLFATIRNTEQVWPAILGHRNMNGGNVPPWPDDMRGYAIYLTRPEVEAWCPTGPEQDERWREVFEERIREHQAGLSNLEPFRHLGGYRSEVTAGLVVPSLPGAGSAA